MSQPFRTLVELKELLQDKRNLEQELKEAKAVSDQYLISYLADLVAASRRGDISSLRVTEELSSLVILLLEGNVDN